MPHKNNPVRSVLIRRAALTAGPLAATLHTASAVSVDERADGALARRVGHHCATLARRTVVAAAHTTELVTGLRVDADRAAANLAAAGDLGAEQRTMAKLTGRATHSDLPRRDRPIRRRHAGPRRAATSRSARDRPRLVGTDFGGPADAPLLLLGPSLGTSADTLWAPAARHLRAHLRVVAWDLPGHGRSPAAEPFTIADLAAAVLALADRLGAETFHYAGDSVGGAVGLQLLLDAPHRVTLGHRAVHRRDDRHRRRLARARRHRPRRRDRPRCWPARPQRWFGPGFVDRQPDRRRRAARRPARHRRRELRPDV